MTSVIKKSAVLAFYVFLTFTGLESAQAFIIIPRPSAASEAFVPSVSYKLKDGKTGTVTRQPIAFISINRGGTKDFLAQLKVEFPESKGWKFIAADEDLNGSFSVGAYYVTQSGESEVMGCGGKFSFDYLPLKSDPISNQNTELHWIQRTISNHKRGAEHGEPENNVIPQKSNKRRNRPDVPFFDVVTKESTPIAVPPHYEYYSGKVDPENDHQWKAEVYLVSINKKDPKTVTIYNGVSWGWENKILTEPLPEVGIDLKTQP